MKLWTIVRRVWVIYAIARYQLRITRIRIEILALSNVIWCTHNLAELNTTRLALRSAEEILRDLQFPLQVRVNKERDPFGSARWFFLDEDRYHALNKAIELRNDCEARIRRLDAAMLAGHRGNDDGSWPKIQPRVHIPSRPTN